MSSTAILFRSFLIYGICLPVAVFLGYLLATPLDYSTLFGVALVFLLLVAPLLLRWHHPLVIICWNFSAVVPFVRGSPHLWMVMGGVSLVIALVQRALNKKMRFSHVPSVTWPLVFLAVVVLATAQLTGGIGFSIAGSTTGGGKRYVWILAAIIGYFALTTHRIPPQRAVLFVSLFFLGTLTAAVGNLAPLVNPNFYFLFSIFPVEKAGLEAIGNEIVMGAEVVRLHGVTGASLGVFSAMLAVHGLRRMLDLRKWWRLAIFLGAIVIGLFGGYRGILVTFGLILASQFYFERLYRTRLLPISILLTALLGIVLLTMVDRLPLAAQRTLSVLPLKVNPIVRYDAQNSSEWRIAMWKIVLPEVPKYLIVGRGYALNPREIELLTELVKTGRVANMEVLMLTGDYHNGPLSVIMAFGIFGAIGFVWFLAAALRVLYRNYQYGDPRLRNINTFLLACFVARMVFFLAVFGAFSTEFCIFTGLVGLSVSLNGGVASRKALPEPEPALGGLELAKA